MKILFYRYNSICEPDILSVFQKFGFTVYEERTEMTNKELTPIETIELLKERLMSTPIDCVFSINFFPVVSEVCNIFHIRYICITVDSPVLELYTSSIKNPWNRIFLFDMAQYSEFHKLNPKCIFHLPLAASFEKREEVINQASSNTRNKYTHDISFVGSLYTEKCDYDKLENPPEYLCGYLDALMSAQQTVYGYYFIEEVLSAHIISSFKEHFPEFYTPPETSFLSDRTILAQLYIGNKISALERVKTMQKITSKYPVDIYTGSDTSNISGLRNHGFAKTETEMPIIFHQSKINLNITSKAIRAGLPLRIFDILSCGGFVLTNYQEEITEYFTPGEDLAVYSSEDELMNLIDYYLSHEKDRKEIAQNGFEKLKKYHTWENRLATIFEIAYSF